jgi:restriction endonuclease S subunit
MTKHSLTKSKRSSAWTRSEKLFEQTKIVVQYIGTKKINACVDNNNGYFDNNTNILTIKDNENFINSYILAILNSKLASYFYFKMRSNLSINQNLLKKLTIPPASLEIQQEIGTWVRKLTDLYDDCYKLKETWTPEKLKEEDNRIGRVEGKIDELVCDLYGVDYEDLE